MSQEHDCPRIDRISLPVPVIRPDVPCAICEANIKAKYAHWVPFLPELRAWLGNGSISTACQTALYEHFSEDMPYGTMKARDGDPDNWLADRPYLIRELIDNVEFYFPPKRGWMVRDILARKRAKETA